MSAPLRMPARCLVMGGRTAGDNAFYPDDDLVRGADENGELGAHEDERRY